jgi:hypothetical protein
MAVTCKSNVRLRGITGDLIVILDALVRADEDPVDGQPADLMVTSINDSTHMPTSKHYLDKAVDVRSNSFRDDKAVKAFTSMIGLSLGARYTVLYEDAGTPNAHIHIQVRKGLA